METVVIVVVNTHTHAQGVLGEGAFSVVYKARHVETGVVYAMKKVWRVSNTIIIICRLAFTNARRTEHCLFVNGWH